MSRPPAAPGTVPRAVPLVGRDREQAILRDALAAALAGQGSLVLISGEAGIGKTALAETLLAEAAARGALVLVGRCYDFSETPPYGPWCELFTTAPCDAALPLLPTAVLPSDQAGESLMSQEAIIARVQAYLTALAVRQPLVVLLEDLHWADPASLTLLRVVARGLSEAPVLLLVTYRADELPRQHPLAALLPHLVREARATRLDLHRLEDDDLHTLIQGRYGLPGGDENQLATYLHERAEGNPFYVGEVLRTLEEARAVRPRDGGWALGDLASVGVPPLLRQVIDGRVARLGDGTRELLVAAAVLGQEVPLALWAAVSGATAAALVPVAERAIAARLLAETPDGSGVRFAHALIRETLYEGLGALRRPGWHCKAAEALAAMPAPDPDAVAYHFQRAGDPRAFDWLLAAGERAWRAYAWLTAAERYETALALMEASAATAGRRALLLASLAQLRRYADRHQGTVYLAEARRLAEQAGDGALALACLFDLGHLRVLAGEGRRGLEQMRQALPALEALAPAERARLPTHQLQGIDGAELYHRGALVVQLANHGWLADAHALAAPMIARGEGTTARGLHGLGLVYAYGGQPALATRAYADARAAYRAAGQHVEVYLTLAYDILTVAEPYFADQPAHWQPLLAAAQEGEERTAGAQGRVRRGVELPFLLLHGVWGDARRLGTTALPPMRAWLARHRGDAAAAWTDIRRELSAGPTTAPGDNFLFIALPLQRLAADLALESGEGPAAQAWLTAHDRWLAWSGAVLGQAEGQLGWAAYYRVASDPAAAHRHAEAALARATEPRQPLALLAAHRLLGELATAAGQHAAAQTHLSDALALADACAAPYERALCLLAQAELHAASGEREQALAALDAARTLLLPLEARPALARADAFATRLAAATPAPAAPAGLSPREREVLRLVAEGLTNGQIAQRLFLSPRTVDQHLRAIFNKLGVSTRAAAAAFAVAHGLR